MALVDEFSMQTIQQSVRDSSDANPALAHLRSKIALHNRNDDATTGPNYSRSCFPAGTQILLADRTSKRIEDVAIGDVVMGFDGQRQVPVVVEELESPLRDHYCTLTFDDDSVVVLTREHPLYTLHGWRSLCPDSTTEENSQLLVGQLEIGDHILTVLGQYKCLQSVRTVTTDVQTYNLSKLSSFDTYFANGFLVHNKAQMTMCGKCTPRFADFACITDPALCVPIIGVRDHLGVPK
jgi:hypothetical protein